MRARDIFLGENDLEFLEGLICVVESNPKKEINIRELLKKTTLTLSECYYAFNNLSLYGFVRGDKFKVISITEKGVSHVNRK